jgi:hypothetical protein
MALALLHTAHVVGSQKKGAAAQRKLLGAGGAAAEHTGYLSTKTHGPTWLQLSCCSRCVALRCLISERHRRLVLCRCGSVCAGEKMAREWAHNPGQSSVAVLSFLFSFPFSFLFFSLFSQVPFAVAQPELLHGLLCLCTHSVRLTAPPTLTRSSSRGRISCRCTWAPVHHVVGLARRTCSQKGA